MNALETDAQQVLRMEADAILNLIPRVDEHFDAAVNLILACPGRVVLTGMGKSGIIAHKISATLASTGTPSFYLHPAEGIHGDLGMVTADDVVIALSNSGETGEVLNILPSLRRIGAKLIAMVGNPDSTLAKNSDVLLNVGVEKEACPQTDRQHQEQAQTGRPLPKPVVLAVSQGQEIAFHDHPSS